MKIDVRHSSHLEKSQLNVTPPVSGGKPTFSVVTKDDKTLFTYSFNRKVHHIFFQSSLMKICLCSSYVSMILQH